MEKETRSERQASSVKFVFPSDWEILIIVIRTIRPPNESSRETFIKNAQTIKTLTKLTREKHST